MTEVKLNRHELSRYFLLKKQDRQLKRQIREAEGELAELNQYNSNICPVLTGMPSGNARRDKIADFVIKLEIDRERLAAKIAALSAEQTAIRYEMHGISSSVNKIPNKQLRGIIRDHYFEGMSVVKVAEKNFMSEFGIYKKLERFFGEKKTNRAKCGKGTE